MAASHWRMDSSALVDTIVLLSGLKVAQFCMTMQNAERISRCCVPQSYGLVGAG